jgi:phosphomannomutase
VAAVLPAGRVRFLPGDLLGIVVAEYLRADAAAVPISANDAVERRMSERHVLLRKTKIGSPYVIAALDELGHEGRHPRIVGWEANGGFLLGSDVVLPAGALAALPTRDATLPILANLFAAAERGVALSQLWDELPARFGRSGLIDGVPVAVSAAILAHLVPAGDTVEVAFDAAGNALVLAGPAAAAWRERRATLARFFGPAAGFDGIARINVLDGVRVYFHNGDVAHVRPSGNAPQLRIYANSDSQARADAIVAAGLREPDGILRLMEKAFPAVG